MKRIVLWISLLTAVSGVLGACGEDTGEVTVIEGDGRPEASISVGDSPYHVGAAISLDGSQSKDDGQILTYEWDVDLSDGLGVDATGKTLETSYEEAGGYTVTLTVTDEDGNTDDTSIYLDVTGAPDTEAPVAEAGEDRGAAPYSMLTFDGSASTDNVGINSYSWDFDTADGISEDATGENATHSYSVEDTYTVRLTVTDTSGNESFDEFDVVVAPDDEAPAVELAGPYETPAKAYITFDASSATDNVGVGSYEWDVDGDGTVDGTNATLRYSYQTAGTYNGSLVVADFGGNSTTVDFTVTVTEAQPESIFARPDQVSLESTGDPMVSTITLRYPDGSTESVASPTIDVSNASFVTATVINGNEIEISADSKGVGSLVITDSDTGLSTDVEVRVGGDIVVTGGLTTSNYPADRYFDVAVESGASTEISNWDAGLTPADAETFGGRGYILNSGTPGTENASLLVYDTETLEQIAFCDLEGVGAYGVAAKTPTEVYVSGVGAPFDDPSATDGEPTDSALVKIDPATCTVERVFVPTGDLATNGMTRGSDLDIYGEMLLITDSGLTSTYGYDQPHIRIFDTTNDSQRQVLPLPAECLNASWSTISGHQLITGCTGDYASPGAVVVTNLVSLETESVIELSSGTPSSFAFEPFSGYLFLGDALAANIAIVDVFAGTEIRSLDDSIHLDENGGSTPYDYVPALYVADNSTVVALSFGLDILYTFDPISAPGLQTIMADFEVHPGGEQAGAQLISEQGFYREPVSLSTENAQVSPVGEGSDELVVDGIYGAPSGGGYFAPNADAEKLLTVPADGYIDIDLSGLEVVDGKGADFVIYENPFYSSGDYLTRAVDPARVQVSPDGDSWYDYPVVQNTAFPEGQFTSDVRRFMSGFVGVNAVYANPATNDIPVGSQAAGGDRFDLANVGLPAVQAIRIVDVKGDNKNADIDAVALRNWRSN